MKYNGPFDDANKFVDKFSASLIFDSAVKELMKRDAEIEALVKAMDGEEQEQLRDIAHAVLEEQKEVAHLWEKVTLICYGNA